MIRIPKSFLCLENKKKSQDNLELKQHWRCILRAENSSTAMGQNYLLHGIIKEVIVLICNNLPTAVRTNHIVLQISRALTNSLFQTSYTACSKHRRWLTEPKMLHWCLAVTYLHYPFVMLPIVRYGKQTNINKWFRRLRNRCVKRCKMKTKFLRKVNQKISFEVFRLKFLEKTEK